MIAWLESTFSTLGYFGVFLMLFTENIFPAIPSEVVMPFCGYLAARNDLGLGGVIFFAVLGTMAGQMPWYIGGRLLGEERVEQLARRYGRWMTVTPREVARVFAWFDRHGAASVFFGRMIPAIRAVISIPAGISRMPLGRFLLYSTLGSTIWMGALGYAGYVLGQNYLLVAKYVEPGTKIIAAGVVLFYFVRLALSFRKERPVRES